VICVIHNRITDRARAGKNLFSFEKKAFFNVYKEDQTQNAQDEHPIQHFPCHTIFYNL